MSNAAFAFLYLQLFAGSAANTAINGTAAIINSATGVATPRSKEAGTNMAEELKDFYDTELLENARIKLYYAQFGKTQRLPKNHNGTVEWRKFNTFPKADVLQEGIIPAGKAFGMTALTGSVEQYGMYTAITDKLELQAYDDIIAQASIEMGASAAETQEALTRDALLVGTNVMYCDNVTSAGVKVGNTPTSAATMGCSETNGYSKLTSKMLSKAATIMKKNRAPQINGKYYMVVHPSVVFDLRNDPGWLSAHEYAKPEEIFNGEIGELHGIRFISDEFAPVLKGNIGESSYTNKDGGCVYACYLFGQDAFGIIDPEGGALEMIVHDKDEAGGPLNQWSTIGYKFMTNGATILYQERMLRVMCVSSEFSATDEVN